MSVNFNAANVDPKDELDKRARPQEIEINGYVTTLAVSDYDVARLGYKVASAPENKAVVVVENKGVENPVDLTEGEDTAAFAEDEEETEDDAADTDAADVPAPRSRRRR